MKISATTKAHASSSRVLARNTVFNILSQIAVAMIAFLSIPVIVRMLGTVNYGIFSLAIVAFGTFAILDFGLGRSTTKFVAEYLCNRESDHLNLIVWTSFVTQITIGIFGGVILALLSDYLIQHVIKVPLILQNDALWSFYFLAMAVPLVLGGSTLRGALEGAQRFDLVNLVRFALNASAYLIPLIAGIVGLRISIIVGLMVFSRFIGMAVYLLLCLYTIPMLRIFRFCDGVTLYKFLSYTKWVAISNLIVPFLCQIDRYLIAAVLTVEMVTFYSVPYEILSALWIIPGSISAVLFPVFGGIKNHNDCRLADLYIRPLKYILILLGPVVVTLVTFSSGFLLLWQGDVFARQSTLVLQILVVAVLINSLEWVPANLIMGFGRPDITAVCHMLQLPLYLCIAYVLILRWGIVGAAAAFAIRVIFEAIFIFSASFRILPQLGKKIIDRRLFGAIAALILLTSVLAIGARTFSNTAVRMSIAAVSLTSFIIIAWTWLMDSTDRELLRNLIPGIEK